MSIDEKSLRSRITPNGPVSEASFSREVGRLLRGVGQGRTGAVLDEQSRSLCQAGSPKPAEAMSPRRILRDFRQLAVAGKRIKTQEEGKECPLNVQIQQSLPSNPRA